MTKNGNAHFIRMVNSLRNNYSDALADEFEARYSLSQSANIEKKFDWAKATCNYLEEHFEDDTIISIRKQCRCNDGKSNANKMKKYLNKAKSIKEFVDMFNESETFASLTYITENRILYCYPECYCSCVKRIPQELSKTWCYCTLGNAEGTFRELLQKDVKISLLESIKTGGKRCVMEVEW